MNKIIEEIWNQVISVLMLIEASCLNKENSFAKDFYFKIYKDKHEEIIEILIHDLNLMA